MKVKSSTINDDDKIYILKNKNILPGDIILTATSTINSKVIRKTTNGNFSHAILCVLEGSYIHADLNGVHSGNIQRLLFKSTDNVKLFRLKNRSEHLIKIVCDFARSKIGMQYSKKEAASSVVFRESDREDNSNRQYCSRLVTQSYDSAGIKLTLSINHCYPEDIAKSPLLYEVPDVLSPATQSDIEFANSENPLELQAEITNKIFYFSRELSGLDIQYFSQLYQYVFNEITIEKEKDLVDFIKNSGYWDLWKIDTQKNPWRYEKYLLIDILIKIKNPMNLINQEIEIAKNDINRYSKNLHLLEELTKNKKSIFFLNELNLYKKLVELAKGRLERATSLIQNF